MNTKLIAIGIILMSATSVCAWDEEGGLTEDELFDIMFNSAYMYTDINNPKWYSPVLNTIDDWCVKYEAYFTHTPPTVETRVIIKKMVWTGSYYVEDIDFIDLDRSEYHTMVANGTQTITTPIMKNMQEVFKNNTNEFEDFTTTDEDLSHPDVLNVSIEIDGGGDSLDYSSYGYITFNDAALDELANQIANQDYGYDSSGRGSDAGSGSIYEGISLSTVAEGEGDDMMSAFSMLFYILIPLIFMLCILQFVFGLV